MKYAWRLLLLLGILIAIVGVGSDYLLPGASPGLNLPQLLIIIAGIVISLGSAGAAASPPSEPAL